jgi:hypothetical protein
MSQFTNEVGDARKYAASVRAHVAAGNRDAAMTDYVKAEDAYKLAFSVLFLDRLALSQVRTDLDDLKASISL